LHNKCWSEADDLQPDAPIFRRYSGAWMTT
jgi:hypothetical protein